MCQKDAISFGLLVKAWKLPKDVLLQYRTKLLTMLDERFHLFEVLPKNIPLTIDSLQVARS